MIGEATLRGCQGKDWLRCFPPLLNYSLSRQLLMKVFRSEIKVYMRGNEDHLTSSFQAIYFLYKIQNTENSTCADSWIVFFCRASFLSVIKVVLLCARSIALIWYTCHLFSGLRGSKCNAFSLISLTLKTEKSMQSTNDFQKEMASRLSFSNVKWLCVGGERQFHGSEVKWNLCHKRLALTAAW